MGSLRNGAVRAKILIWGAPGAGKTTTLTYVSSKLKIEQKGTIKKVTLKNPTANYELLPVELGIVKGVKTQLDFMTAPGAWGHLAVRKRLLQGVDGVVFVANSSGSALKDNQKALAELDEALKGMGKSLVTVPVVFEWMNQKAMGAMPSDELAAKLNRIGAPSFPVPADEMGGILKAFATISKMVVKNVRDEYDQGKLIEPAGLDIDFDELPAKVSAGSSAAAAKPDDSEANVNPFADLASELDEISDELEIKMDEPAPPVRAAARALDLDDDAPIGEDELSALLDDPKPASAPPKRTNGAAKFKLVSAGEPTLSADGTLALPIRIGNEHGEEVAMTISVKVTPG